MTTQAVATNVPEGLIKLAGWCAYLSGVVAVIGIVFLGLMFAGAERFGPMNDVTIIIQYILVLPIVITVWMILRPLDNPLNTPMLVLGLAAMLAVIVLQVLLVTGVLPFERQVFMVTAAFVVGIVWYVATGRMARPLGLLPQSVPLQVLSGLYLGYPVWAFKVGALFLGG